MILSTLIININKDKQISERVNTRFESSLKIAFALVSLEAMRKGTARQDGAHSPSTFIAGIGENAILKLGEPLGRPCNPCRSYEDHLCGQFQRESASTGQQARNQ